MSAILNFFNSIPITARVVALLCCSNLFMLFAWYGHLRSLKEKPYIIALLVSWGIAFFEYTLMIPANRLGATQFSLAQRSGISQGLLSLYERGEKLPGLQNMIRLADALGVTLDELAGRTPPAPQG